METSDKARPNGTASSSSRALYRAVWRWHFYAGLLVLPFLALLAVTGGVYLFHNEFDAFYYQDWQTVEARQTSMLPASVLIDRADDEIPGETARITLPASPTSAARIFSTTRPHARFSGYTGYVDPYIGEVLGVMDHGGVVGVVRRLHSLSFSVATNWLIEIVSGWALILVATGVFLWWPRGRGTNAVKMRGTPGKRVFWRDLHAVTGIFAGLIIAFLAVTGMPWSAVWGQGFHALVASTGTGSPPVPQSGTLAHAGQGLPGGHRGHAGHHVTHAEHLGNVGWTLNPMPVPGSNLKQTQPIGLDKAIARFKELGFSGGFRVALPAGPTGVYSAMANAGLGEREGIRVAHLDQYTGKMLADYRAQDFGIGSQIMTWAISVHQGDQYGLINQLVMLAGCIAILMLTLTAPVMWWWRRPRGSLGVPPEPGDKRVVRTVFAIVVIGGIIFPLVGLSIVVAMSIDRILIRGLGRLRRDRSAATA